MKSGAAYLPIDQEYPGDRIGYMLEDSCPKILLTSKRYAVLWTAKLAASIY
jgi:non-ribosomal peptide synthetase component F